MAIHIRIHRHFSGFFLVLLATPLQWAVDLIHLHFPSWPKHLVTPLTADSSHCQKRSSWRTSIASVSRIKPWPLHSIHWHYLGTKI